MNLCSKPMILTKKNDLCRDRFYFAMVSDMLLLTLF